MIIQVNQSFKITENGETLEGRYGDIKVIDDKWSKNEFLQALIKDLKVVAHVDNPKDKKVETISAQAKEKEALKAEELKQKKLEQELENARIEAEQIAASQGLDELAKNDLIKSKQDKVKKANK